MEWAPWLLLVMVAVVFGQWLVVLTWRLAGQCDEIADVKDLHKTTFDDYSRLEERMYEVEFRLRRAVDPTEYRFARRSPWCRVVDTTRTEEGA